MTYFEEMESTRKMVKTQNKTFRFTAETYSGLSTAECTLSPLLMCNGYENFYHDVLPVYLDVKDIEKLIKDLEKVKKNILEGLE